MKKIAYLFHGHSRTWKQCYQSFFDNVYSELPGDIYIHTWDTTNSLYRSCWNGGVNYEKFEGDSLKIVSEIPDFQNIYNVYKPKIFIIEPNRAPDLSILDSEKQKNDLKPAHLGTKNMLYQSKTLFDIANTQEKYDYFFSTRMDLFYKNKLTEEEKIEMFQPKILTCSDLYMDVWMFGDEESMKIKTDYFYNIDKYWFNQNINFFTQTYEYCLFAYLKDNKIPQRASSLKFEFIRLPI